MNPVLTSFLALFVVSTKAASLPVSMDQLVDGIQNLLTAPEETGLRLKRSPVGDWDKEINLETIGVVFRLKYNDPAHPFKGGHALIKFPGKRFFSNLPFDDVDFDIEFNGGDMMAGFFDMKVNYKFVQKYVWFADLPHEGYFEMYRKLEGGMWKTKVTVDNNNRHPRPFFDISLESDHENKVQGIFVYNDNKWEFKLERVPGQSITADFKINGVYFYSGTFTIDTVAKKLNVVANNNGHDIHLDFDLNPSGEWGLHVTGDVYGPVDAKWTMQPDFKKGDIVVKHNNKNIAFIQLTGEAEMDTYIPIPRFLNYVVKYNIDHGQTHQGKAKVKYDGKAIAKKIDINFTPIAGKTFDYVFELDFSAGFKYLSELKLNGNTVKMLSRDTKWTNDATKFEMDTVETFDQTMENPFYNMLTKYVFFGRHVEKGQEVTKIFFNKQVKNLVMNQMKFEHKFVYDGKTWYDVKLDTTVPHMEFKVHYLPVGTTEVWGLDSSLEYTDNHGFTMDYKVQHGDHTTSQGELMFDIKVNDANKLELEFLHKYSQTEESIFYRLSKMMSGRYYKEAERHITLMVDKTKTKNKRRNKIRKYFFFIPVMTLNWELTADGQKLRELVFDNTMDVKTMKVYWSPDVFTKDYNFVQTWQLNGRNGAGSGSWNWELHRGDVSVHKYSNELTWYNKADKTEVDMKVDVVMTHDSPLYSMGYFLYGKFYTTRQRNFKAMYDKQNRNFLLGKINFDDTMTMDGAKYSNMKVDTTSSPYTIVWYQPISGHLFPCVKHLVGQDEVTMNVWHTPGTEFKIHTNLPHIESFKVTTTDTTRKIELNGNELVTVDYTPGSHSISQTVMLPTGEHVTVSLSWPKLELDTTDLEFNVEITPHRKLEGKMGWECPSNQDKKVIYFDIKGNNPYIGEYMIQRNGEYEKISETEYKLTWTGKAEYAKGPLAMYSPIDTNIMTSINTANLHVDANVVKSFGGRSWGFTLMDGQFTMIRP